MTHVDFAVCVWPVYGLTVVQAETNAKTAKIEIVFFIFSPLFYQCDYFILYFIEIQKNKKSI